jgi:hypothetical protein
MLFYKDLYIQFLRKEDGLFWSRLIIKKAFDLFDYDSGGSIDPRGIWSINSELK